MDVQLTVGYELVCNEFDRPISFNSLTSVLKFLNSWNTVGVSMMLFKRGSDKAFIVQKESNGEWVVSSLGFNDVEIMTFQVLLTGG
jgi:hypothetical protein